MNKKPPAFPLQESEAEKRLAVVSKDISKNSNSKPQRNGCKPEETVFIPRDIQIPTNFNRKTSCSNHLSKLAPKDDHTILFRPHILPDKAPMPYPDTYRDRWDKNYVRMPCSPENLYPTPNKKIQKRWELIENTLLQPFRTSQDLEEAILVYNHHYKDKWNFESWHSYVNIELNEDEREDLLTNLLPSMVNLTLQLPTIVTQPPKLLQRGMSHSVTLSQKQASCLLANAFFCTFPRRNSLKSSEYSTYPDINFSKLFRGTKDVVSEVKTEKLKTLLNYFRRILKNTPTGTLTYTRKVLTEEDCPQWEKCTSGVCDLYTVSEGTIEDNGDGFLQVDFANRMIGGGVVGEGCVQEEIRFLICPELILSRLFTEKMEPHESLEITGVERYSCYSGYASSYKYRGNYEDTSLRDQWGRRLTEVVAIDAHVFHCYLDQFRPWSLKRELEKAYCGFRDKQVQERFIPAVATGNWGCGAFGGDKHLKALLQIMAASVARRDLIYFTFYDEEFSNELQEIHTLIKSNSKLTVGVLWKALLKYGKDLKSQEEHIQLFPYLKTLLTESPKATDSNTDEDTLATDPEEPPPEMRGVPCEIPEDMTSLSPEYAASTP